MEIPEDFQLAIIAPDGKTIAEIDLGGYDTEGDFYANSVGDTVMTAVAKFLERKDNLTGGQGESLSRGRWSTG